MIESGYLRLKNLDNDKTFLFKIVDNFKDGLSQPSIDIPFVASKAENRVLFRFTGQARDISFNFALYDSSDDLAEGTHSTVVKTVKEQIQYLQNEIYTKGFDVQWELYSANSNMIHVETPVKGNIENLNVDQKSGPNTVMVGSVTFKVGKVQGGSS